MIIYKEILKIYRVKNWYYQIGLILIGFLLVSKLNFDVIGIILLGSMLISFAYSFNNYCEKKEKRKYFIAPLIISIILLPFFNFMQILLSISALVIATLYSMRPIALREKPFLGSLANAFAVPILFLLGYLYSPIINLTVFLFTFLLFCFVMVGQLLHETTHLSEDKKKKIVTTALLLGAKKIKTLSFVFLFLSIVSTSFMFYLKIVNVVFLLSNLFFIAFIYFQIKKNDINLTLRKTYIISCTFLGIIYIVSFCI